MKLLFEPPSDVPASATIAILDPTQELEPWMQRHVAPGSVQISRRALETMNGWPLELVTYEVAGALCVLAVFAFFDLSAAVIIRGLDREWLQQRDVALLAAFRAALPDWHTDEPLTIAELWAPIG